MKVYIDSLFILLSCVNVAFPMLNPPRPAWRLAPSNVVASVPAAPILISMQNGEDTGLNDPLSSGFVSIQLPALTNDAMLTFAATHPLSAFGEESTNSSDGINGTWTALPLPL